MHIKPLFVAALIAGAFFIIGVWTIPEYGINWDEPVHYLRGQALLRYLLTGKKDYIGLPKLRIHYDKFDTAVLLDDIVYDDNTKFRRSIYQFDRNGDQFTFRYWERQIGSHPPLNGLLASLSNYIFYQKFGWMGDIESYHLFIVAASALLVLSIVYAAATWFGIFGGVIAGVSLALYPIFWAESHINIKDSVETAFYSITVISFVNVVRTKQWRWVLLTIIAVSLALGTKFNILFAPITLGLWFLWYVSNTKHVQKIFRSMPLWVSIIGAITIPLIVLYAIWPSLWLDPIKGFMEVIGFYQDIGYGTVYQPLRYLTLLGINLYPLRVIIYSTPLVTLLLFGFGVFASLRNGRMQKDGLLLLILIWFLVPIIRVSLPGASIYAGVRQIMEYIPPMAILAGIGANHMVTLLHSYIVTLMKRLRNKQLNSVTMKQLAIALKIMILLMFLPITFKMWKMHPNESAYFNPLIGGLKGAYLKNFPDWGVTLGTAYWQGVQWLNDHGEREAKLTLVRGLMANVPRIQLRRDINYSHTYFSGESKDGEYIMEVNDYYWERDVAQEKKKYLATLLPVYQVIVDGVPILNIWKNDAFHSKTSTQ